MTSAELRTALRCLYFKHYLRWDRPFLDEQQFAHRQKLIDDLYASQLSQMGNRDTFSTEGDDRRLGSFSFQKFQPKIGLLFSRIFGPKMPRLLVVIGVLLAIEHYLQSVWLLIPFIFVVTIAYCLAEDTESATKILTLVVKRIPLGRLRPS
jgi:hypothetical protein